MARAWRPVALATRPPSGETAAPVFNPLKEASALRSLPATIRYTAG